MRKLVYAFIVKGNQTILLVKRDYYWRLPGGKVLRGEHVLIGLRRIVKATLLVDTGEMEFYNVYENKHKNEREYYYKVMLSALSFNASKEITFEYFSVDTLPNTITTVHKRRIRSFFKKNPSKP